MQIRFPLSTKEKIINHRRGRPFIFLLTGILSLASLIYMVVQLSPSTNPAVLGYQLPLIPLFIVLVFTTLYFLGSYIFRSKSHGILIGTFTVVYLFFRLSDLTHPFFFILLFALFLTLELFVSYRK
jgi:hypothetical protein